MVYIGTHTYPLSFALPATLPPTARYPHSSTTYRIKAHVHRPGAFTPKLKASREVFLHSCPVELEGDGEAGPEDLGLRGAGAGGGNGANGDASANANGAPPSFGAGGSEAPNGLNLGGVGGAVNVEREWDDCLRYRIEFGKRKVEMGGYMDLRIMLMPMEKIRIWRIGVYLEGQSIRSICSIFQTDGKAITEKIDYFSKFKKVIARDPPQYHELWSLRAHKPETVTVQSHGHTKEKQKFVEVPLFPITSDSPDALFNSPLAQHVLASGYAPIPHHDLHRSVSNNKMHGERAGHGRGHSRNISHSLGRGQDRYEEEEVDDEEGLDALPTLLGPGPYHIGHRLKIPTCDKINASYVNAHERHRHHLEEENGENGHGWVKSNAEARHSIKLILRVEKVGADASEKLVKGRKWDIVIQIGVSILSVSLHLHFRVEFT